MYNLLFPMKLLANNDYAFCIVFSFFLKYVESRRIIFLFKWHLSELLLPYNAHAIAVVYWLENVAVALNSEPAQ